MAENNIAKNGYRRIIVSVPTRRDYYDILGVRRDANDDDVKRAFRKLAKQYHPDANPGDDKVIEKFKEIGEAYSVLSDPEKRQLYDRYGHNPPQGGSATDFAGFDSVADIFSEFFGGGMRSAGRRAPQAGVHLKYNLTLAFEEAVFGVDKDLEVPRLETCPHCHGSGAEPGTTPMRCPQCGGAGEVRRATQSIFGSFVNVTACPRCQGEGEVVATPCSKCRGQKRLQITRKISVKIPAGVDEGTQIRLAGEGEAGTRGGPSGNLYVVVGIKKHPLFHREGADLHLDLPLNIAQAALGDQVDVPTLDGDFQLTIPASTQQGKAFRIKGQGVPHLRGNGRGDLIVTTQIVVPKHLSEKQKALLRELQRELGKEPIGDGSVLSKVKGAFRG